MPPTPRKATHTEIHGPDGELIVLPESPLEITRRVNNFDELEKSNAILRRMVEKATGWTCEEIEEEIARTESRNLNER